MRPADCRDLRHPVQSWSPRDWDEFLHLNELTLDEQQIAAARARQTPTTTIPAARSAT